MICVFIAEGFEEIEALTVVDLLRRAEIHVKMVSISDSREVTGGHGITVLTDCYLEEMDFDLIEGFILPGGMPGTINLGNNHLLCEKLVEAEQQGKLVGAICAAPSILGKLGLLKGRKSVCYPGFENQLSGAVIGTENTVTDASIITSRGAGMAISFAEALISYIKDEATAKKITSGILYDSLKV